jgi:O-antigen ligase
MRNPTDWFGHLGGLSIFFSFVTLPAGIRMVKYFGPIPIHIGDLSLVVLLILTIFTAQKRVPVLAGLLVILAGSILGLLANFDSETFIRDLSGPSYAVIAAYVFSGIRYWSQLKLLVRYVAACLWVSSLVEMLMNIGAITNPYDTRASFSGAGVSDLGISRLVTNTHLLALATISVCFGCLALGKRKLSQLWGILLPALIVAGLASTRIGFAMGLIPLGLLFASARAGVTARNVTKGILITLGLTVPVLLVASASNVGLGPIAEYVANFSGRIVALLSSDRGLIDQSTLYRTYEFHNAWISIREYPVFGKGFGSTYMLPFFRDDSWLALNGGTYVHNIYLWLLVKTGFAGLILWMTWISVAIFGVKEKFSEFLILRATLIATIAIGLVWNVVANYPDSLILGCLLGLTYAARRGFAHVDDKSVTTPA